MPDEITGKSTVKELLSDWKLRRAGIIRIMNRSDDLEQVKTASAMYYQLGVCIQELEKVLAGSWLSNALTKNILHAGSTYTVNTTGEAEPILTPEQWDQLTDKEE